ncbi:UAA transporter [Rhodofomes roseus]|uniref:UAA transporter n=1 Tax=Rhodofomes roseus TaxID=34475 RepID=A0ABQ8KXL4_9APHY|nr:UAA transporter [Rhodofomes roseus]KAH9843773.1 UAA transporter [Rhodofomes roseus]
MSTLAHSSDILKGLSLTVLSEWVSILALIFGGCCSNALTLEQLTTRHPRSGNLITFAQFLIITVVFLPRFVVYRRTPIPHITLRKRRVPLAPYMLQVSLFAATSLLNNAAFAYAIPMPVHIIFRSGGLVASLLLNWLFVGRRYNVIQITSVAVVSLGVIVTTLSAAVPKRSGPGTPMTGTDPSLYATGVGILTLALFLSGLLGVLQDRMYAKYGRKDAKPQSTGRDGSEANRDVKDAPDVKAKEKKDGTGPRKADEEVPPWQEALFYMHFLSMPLFFFVRRDLLAQFHALGAEPTYNVPLPSAVRSMAAALPGSGYRVDGEVMIPEAYVPLVLNTLTQLLCVAGVHRLTARVSSLTVSLVLVVRKAVSLLISVALFRGAGREVGGGRAVMMWAGAALVFAGTVGYSIGSRQGQGRPRIESDRTKRE